LTYFIVMCFSTDFNLTKAHCYSSHQKRTKFKNASSFSKAFIDHLCNFNGCRKHVCGVKFIWTMYIGMNSVVNPSPGARRPDRWTPASTSCTRTATSDLPESNVRTDCHWSRSGTGTWSRIYESVLAVIFWSIFFTQVW
jgi:hypothetical protein